MLNAQTIASDSRSDSKHYLESPSRFLWLNQSDRSKSGKDTDSKYFGSVDMVIEAFFAVLLDGFYEVD